MVFLFGKAGSTESSRNRRRHSSPNRARRRSPFEPCRTEREADERITRSDNHEEPGVGRTDCRPRDAGAVYAPLWVITSVWLFSRSALMKVQTLIGNFLRGGKNGSPIVAKVA